MVTLSVTSVYDPVSVLWYSIICPALKIIGTIFYVFICVICPFLCYIDKSTYEENNQISIFCLYREDSCSQLSLKNAWKIT